LALELKGTFRHDVVDGLFKYGALKDYRFRFDESVAIITGQKTALGQVSLLVQAVCSLSKSFLRLKAVHGIDLGQDLPRGVEVGKHGV